MCMCNTGSCSAAVCCHANSCSQCDKYATSHTSTFSKCTLWSQSVYLTMQAVLQQLMQRYAATETKFLDRANILISHSSSMHDAHSSNCCNQAVVQQLMQQYAATGTAFLNLAKLKQPPSSLLNPGPTPSLAGDLQTVEDISNQGQAQVYFTLKPGRLQQLVQYNRGMGQYEMLQQPRSVLFNMLSNEAVICAYNGVCSMLILSIVIQDAATALFSIALNMLIEALMMCVATSASVSVALKLPNHLFWHLCIQGTSSALWQGLVHLL